MFILGAGQRQRRAYKVGADLGTFRSIVEHIDSLTSSRPWLKTALWLLVFIGLGLFVAIAVPEITLRARGVYHLSERKVAPGLNLVQLRQEQKAHLVDHRGRIRHTWELSKSKSQDGWHAVEASRDRGLFVVLEDKSLTKLSSDSKIEWKVKDGFHHDLCEVSTGEIFALVRRPKTIAFREHTVPVLKEYVVKISSGGRRLDERDIHLLFEDLIQEQQWKAAENFHRANPKILPSEDSPLDLLHLNALESIDLAPFNRTGTGWVLSSKLLNMLLVTDRDFQERIWYWGAGTLLYPHDPNPTAAGKILVFDNGNYETRPYSRIIEVDPRNNTVSWSLDRIGGKRFFSQSKSSVHELSNGSILIGSSHELRVVEITRSGEILWDYYHPSRIGSSTALALTKARRIDWNG